MKTTVYTVKSDTYVQKHKYINISDTKINIFSGFPRFTKESLMRLWRGPTLHPRGTLHRGGRPLPGPSLESVVLRASKTAW